ncbi:hypothetical protein [Mycolicibacterium fortuitum]|uniref:Uncharacterized protein n=2 Tax=Mycolicibacterium fortuitum TaxID=1766 RepID=A0AAE5AGT3_MYCFO|nr:hypothetical protein [Mycolicibacterium fortuitum]GAT04562.1 acyl-CoA dehydrogenase protein [Mycolicibacterium fortuitum subsp. acetamidolyticum]MDV7195350.1 hypothetical protein [Mycolicibacterium fortuitum]MDV7209065.1 hypothetical protein [Mycolicibacterium fortuitum]MDV7262464.1 hypothetical protein [Mycolicibacterium fortuitum]MDV7287929.1 hypothetical protein [Mycolicibacterium fortuitum]
MNGPKLTHADIRNAVETISAARELVCALEAADDTLSTGASVHLEAAASNLTRHAANPSADERERELTDMGYEVRDCAGCGQRGPTRLLSDQWYCADGAACADRRLQAHKAELARIRGY